MSEQEYRRALVVQVWLEDYKAMVADIGARVDLQHRNANVAIVLMSAFTGYLVNFWNSKDLSTLLTSPAALLVALVPLLAQLFVWRHIDHDSNIIDKAQYIQSTVRPALAEATWTPDVMSFEAALNTARLRRPVLLSPLSLLGNEHVLILGYSGGYLAAGWSARLSVDAGGPASDFFNGLLYTASAAAALSVLMSLVTATRYARLGRLAAPAADAVAPEATTVPVPVAPPSTGSPRPIEPPSAQHSPKPTGHETLPSAGD